MTSRLPENRVTTMPELLTSPTTSQAGDSQPAEPRLSPSSGANTMRREGLSFANSDQANSWSQKFASRERLSSENFWIEFCACRSHLHRLRLERSQSGEVGNVGAPLYCGGATPLTPLRWLIWAPNPIRSNRRTSVSNDNPCLLQQDSCNVI